MTYLNKRKRTKIYAYLYDEERKDGLLYKDTKNIYDTSYYWGRIKELQLMKSKYCELNYKVSKKAMIKESNKSLDKLHNYLITSKGTKTSFWQGALAVQREFMKWIN